MFGRRKKPAPNLDESDGITSEKKVADSTEVNNMNAFGGDAPKGQQQDSLTDTMEKIRLGQERNKADKEAKKKNYSSKDHPSISYAAERVIGNGSFGVVYQASVVETGEVVAIKKVLQDRRFKNRELQMMAMLDHPCVVSLKHCFYSKGDKSDDVYLNLVMEYIPDTIHRTLQNHTRAKKLISMIYIKVYMYQISRSIAYIHSQGVCHRDIKPHNLLLNTRTHEAKLCDFGSAKMLKPGEPNVSYICSRYYRAPELVFEATQYTNAIDVWSLGCVIAEMLLGRPLFPGESGVDQLIEIIKILGTPTREDIKAMNPNHSTFNFPQIKPTTWSKVFNNQAPPEVIDLLSRILIYPPSERIDPFDILVHPFFDELRQKDARLPNGRPLPDNIFNFTELEWRIAGERGIRHKLLPQGVDPETFVPFPNSMKEAARAQQP